MRVNIGYNTKKILLKSGNYDRILNEIKNIDNSDKVEEVIDKYCPKLLERYNVRLKVPRNSKYFDKCLMLTKK